MKTEGFIKLLRKVIREELRDVVRDTVRDVLTEALNSDTHKPKKVVKSKLEESLLDEDEEEVIPVRKFKARKFTADPAINALLNETAATASNLKDYGNDDGGGGMGITVMPDPPKSHPLHDVLTKDYTKVLERADQLKNRK